MKNILISGGTLQNLKKWFWPKTTEVNGFEKNYLTRNESKDHIITIMQQNDTQKNFRL